jgi:cytochrome P450
MDELLTNATTIVGAGSETSASILTAVTSFLVDKPEKQEKLAKEVRSAFTTGAEITADAVSRLPYLVACIDESMRLFPQTGSPSLRLTDRDTIISGVPVPKDVSISPST